MPQRSCILQLSDLRNEERAVFDNSCTVTSHFPFWKCQFSRPLYRQKTRFSKHISVAHQKPEIADSDEEDDPDKVDEKDGD